MSDVPKIRPFVQFYCIGKGLDIGCGYDKIMPGAIGIDRAKPPRNGKLPPRPIVVDWAGKWEDFLEETTGSWDYIFSSHLLENYEEPYAVIRRWLRRVRRGGHLVLCLPNDRLYRAAAAANGAKPNAAHRFAWDGSDDFVTRFRAEGLTSDIVAQGDPPGYSFYVVIRRGQEKV